MRRQCRPLSLAALWIALLPGCYSWHDYGPAPAPALRDQPHAAVYVVRRGRGGSMTELKDAAIHGDSLVGTGMAARPGAPRPRMAIPLSDIETVRTHRFNGGKTAGLIGGLVTAAALPVLIALATYHDES
jgi:hypothetical protein